MRYHPRPFLIPENRRKTKEYHLPRHLIPVPKKPVSAAFIFDTKEVFIMTENEKKLLQAKHRMEEAQARDRVKERKARTRRLIQEGAILEKVYPAAAEMDLEKLEDFLLWALR